MEKKEREPFACDANNNFHVIKLANRMFFFITFAQFIYQLDVVFSIHMPEQMVLISNKIVAVKLPFNAVHLVICGKMYKLFEIENGKLSFS